MLSAVLSRAAMRQIGSALNSTHSVSHEMTLNWFDAYEQYCGQNPENCAKPGIKNETLCMLDIFVRAQRFFFLHLQARRRRNRSRAPC